MGGVGGGTEMNVLVLNIRYKRVDGGVRTNKRVEKG